MSLEIGSGYIGSVAQPQGIVARGFHVRPGVRPESASPVGLARDAQAVLVAGRIKGEIASVARGQATAERGIKFATAATDGLDALKANLDRMEVIAKASHSTTKVKDKAGNIVELADSDQERAIYQVEFDALRTEIDEIVDRTKFNGTKLLDGGGGASQSFSFKVGGGSADATGNDVTITLKAATVAQLDAGLGGADLSTLSGATAAEAVVKSAQATLNDIRGTVLGAQGRFDAAITNGDTKVSFLKSEADQRLEFKAIEDAARALAGNVARSNGITLEGFEERTQLKAQSTLLTSAPGVFAGAGAAAPTPAGPDAETTGDLISANTVGGRTSGSTVGRDTATSAGSASRSAGTGTTHSVDIEA